MGYFPNSDASVDYESQYCDNCVHQKIDDGGCAVFLAHIVHNYEECNNEKSILHELIPIDGIENKKCLMFYAGPVKTENQNFDPPLKGEVAKFKEKEKR